MNSLTLNRRQALVVLGSAALAGCGSAGVNGVALASAPFDAGGIDQYPADGAYSTFRDTHGVFMIRQSGRIFAQSAICTHRNCKIWPATGGFECRCHGSTFTLDGKVTEGPARRNLPRFAISKDARDHLIVDPRQTLSPQEFDRAEGFVAV